MKRISLILCMILFFISCESSYAQVYNIYYLLHHDNEVYMYDGTISLLEGGEYHLTISLADRIIREYLNENDLLSDNSSNKYSETGLWVIQNQFDLPYINLDSKSGSTLINHVGILKSDENIYLFNDENSIIIESYVNSNYGNALPWIEKVNASSELTEKGFVYKAENVSITYFETATRTLPWVEGKKGSGIGEFLNIEINSLGIPVEKLLFSNGFVDFKRPELYRSNSRMKKLEISNSANNDTFTFELEDTPQLQSITLPEEFVNDQLNLEIKILDIYPGERWDDACLNLVIPIGRPPEFP